MEFEFEKILRDSPLTPYLTIDAKIKLLVKRLYIFLLLIFLFVAFAPWTPVVRGIGQVIAFDPNDRLQYLESPIEGRISEWFVQEGSKVEKGDLIAKIVDIDPERTTRLEIKLTATKERLEALIKQKQRSKLHVDRMTKLYDKGIESKRSLELAEIDLFKTIQEKNKIESEIQDLESQIARQSSQDIFAQTNGVIMNVFAPENTKVVKMGEVIAKIAPSEVSLASEVIIEGKDLALVRTDQKVRLMFEGWPAVQLVAWPSIAVGTFQGEIRVIDPGDDKKGNFRIIITPQEDWPTDVIRMGSKVKCWVLLKRVPLWWEIWRRFSGVPPSV